MRRLRHLRPSPSTVAASQMHRRRRRIVAGTLFALLLGSAPAAQAALLPTGSTPYVRLVHLGHGRLTAALTPRGRRLLGPALRGTVLDATCTRLGASVQGFSTGSRGAAYSLGLGPHGQVRYRFAIDRTADFCDIGLARLRTTGRSARIDELPGPPFDTIALSQTGAQYLDQDRVAARMDAVILTAASLARGDTGGHFPSPAAVVSALSRSSSGWRAVALATPDGTPPPGEIGVFSDAVDHTEAVGLSALGRRLFIDQRDGVLSTNTPEHLFRVISGAVAAVLSR